MKAIVLFRLWLISLFRRESTEEKIMRLARKAHAKGWVFARWFVGLRSPGCGCPLQAISWMGGKGKPWGEVATDLGIECSYLWGIGFDHALSGAALLEGTDPDYAMGVRIARRLKAEGLA